MKSGADGQMKFATSCGIWRRRKFVVNLSGLLRMENGDQILPFVRCFYGRTSTYLWEDEVGDTQEFPQGGEQGQFRLRPISTSAIFWMLNFWTTKGGAPKGGGPKFRAFFHRPATVFILSSSLGGLFMEFLVFEAQGP